MLTQKETYEYFSQVLVPKYESIRKVGNNINVRTTKFYKAARGEADFIPSEKMRLFIRFQGIEMMPINEIEEQALIKLLNCLPNVLNNCVNDFLQGYPEYRQHFKGTEISSQELITEIPSQKLELTNSKKVEDVNIIISEVIDQMFDRLGIIPNQSEISGSLFNLTLAGALKVKDQNTVEMPFIMNAENLRPMKGEVKKEHIKDTLLLIRELRRRINIFTSLNSNRQTDIIGKLMPEVRELYIAIERARGVDPTGTAERIHELSGFAQKEF